MIDAVRSRRGVTLVELVVALTILAIASAVVLLEMRERHRTTVEDEFVVLVGEARRKAIATGRPQMLRLRGVLAVDSASSAEARTPRREVELIAFPDGSVLADSALHIERLSGLAASARRSR